jgi:aspartokinase/homoserine dehydrogenase 1
MVTRVFLMGFGKVGRAFTDELRVASPRLLSDRGLDLRLFGVANSRLMAFDDSGMDPAEADGRLAAGEASRAAAFAGRIVADFPRASILVDCTASAEVAALHVDLLKRGISVVTANKIANSGSRSAWQALRDAARSGRAAYRYEATVGAGLPVIRTIQDLLATGDEVISIEAVLSGTISHIFNHLSADKAFSALVREAMALGYTEPDPRVDLSALDAARKAIILAREIGQSLEPTEVATEAILSPAALEAAGQEAFLSALEAEDDRFEAMRREAEAEASVLRHVATIGGGKVVLGIRRMPLGTPLAGLGGNDNIIAISSTRYSRRPLVVQGPGAGPSVTASAVLVDVIRVAESRFAG